MARGQPNLRIVGGEKAKEAQRPAGRVLVIDNDLKTLRMLKIRLANEGFEVITAPDGPQGLKSFATSSPEIVLLDVNMPGMSGLDVLAEIRKCSLETPVILMTAYGSEAVAVEAMKKGASDYVSKPFNSKEICHVLWENLERSRALINRNKLLEKLKVASVDLVSRIHDLEKNNQELLDSNKELLDSVETKSKVLSDLEDANIHLREISIRDGLTELYNHLYFQERLSEEFTRSQRYNSSLSFIMLDIDGFKEINDTYGHLKGDDVLVSLARLLTESTRGVDIVARYGGEEFALLLPQVDISGAGLMAERIRVKVESYFSSPDSGMPRVTISQGVAGLPNPKIKTKTDLIRAADRALYRAKQNGKNRVEVDEEE